MKNNKVLLVLGYIIIGIVLIPIAAIGIYIAPGALLFYILYIYNRKKYGPMDPKEGKDYKIASTIIIIIGLFILVYAVKANLWSPLGYLYTQILVFVGLLPVCYHIYKEIKKNKELDNNLK